MTPEVELRLRDMLVFAQDAIAILDRHGEDGVLADRGLELGLIKAVEVVGEAAWKIPKAERPDLDGLSWDAAAGLRHHLVHGYGRIRLDLILDVVRTKLPPLVASLETFLGDAPP